MQQGRVAHLAGQAHRLIQGVERLLSLGRSCQKAVVGAQAGQAAGQGRRVAQVAGQGQRLRLSSRRPTGGHLGLVVGQVPQRLQLSGGISLPAGCRQRCPIRRQRAFQVAAIVPHCPPLQVQPGAKARRHGCRVRFGDLYALLAPGDRFVVGHQSRRLVGGGQGVLQGQPGPVAGGIVGRHDPGRSAAT